MTDDLLQKLEEKMLLLLTELDALRKEVAHLRQENLHVRTEQADRVMKLQNLISMLDSLDTFELAQTGAYQKAVTA